MQPGDETYILYGALFLVLFARLSHCYLPPRLVAQVLFSDDFFFVFYMGDLVILVFVQGHRFTGIDHQSGNLFHIAA